MKRIALLGSTGSIGRQTLEIVRCFPDRFQVVGLAAGRNIELLSRQVQEFHPRLVSFHSGEASDIARAQLPAAGWEFSSAEEIASCSEVDLVVIATSGKAGLAPTLAAIRAGKKLALANKEVLVMAGELLLTEAQQRGAQILPVDSEHSALWQCLQGEQTEQVSRLILTASGGPFRHYSSADLAAVTVEEALRHPTWQMGKKVTIDSATLMNKGMEVIEAHWLFGMPWEKIEVVIHPESIVHSLVEFVDGSFKAQLSFPDMRLPIQYALFYPERLPNPQLPKLDIRGVTLSFGVPDVRQFPCLELALEAGKRGGTFPAVMAAADEIAVDFFLSRRLGFAEIPRVIGETLERHQGAGRLSWEEILAADAWARATAAEIAAQRGK